ncbi:hypothetical protein F5878DRAFT_356166 [Lentinula raphanica]|uniref:BTB domain-containing protein n=1 Tax=Lentinula raphanica TaxID=153919 RepID=A0AA38P1B4_9AGAR|nr:hypothetical protein F5880DRAFT_1198446 [Lentinula raphanica]KAJ3834455.1 hypothetical protein F5878DRAFT_356166 [Lentinula raphanica]
MDSRPNGSSESESLPVVNVNARFQSSDADVKFRSSDNVDFHIHKRNLEFATGGFPPSNTPSSLDEIVRLSESSTTLEILFQFVYPQRHPSLDKLGFDEVLRVAEAAEKYEVFAALTATHLMLREFLHSHSKQVLQFACIHRAALLVERLAPIMIDIPLSDIKGILMMCPSYFVEWSLFREQYLQLAIALAQSRPQHRCEHFNIFTRVVLNKLDKPSNLMMPNLENLFNIRSIGLENLQVCCATESRKWYFNVRERVAKIPSFTLEMADNQ